MAEAPAGGGGGQLGRFRLDRILGTGGFATVWLAYDEALDASVAIKVLAENWSHNEEIRRRFTEEARILWRMESTHIVKVYGVDATPDGRPYFVMEYADDGSLEDRMRQRHDAGEAFSTAEAVTISLAIADGLVDAQGQGIVHRDLKPSNVMFKTTAAGDKRLVLADFGIARSLEAAGATTISAGTPHYMAPEQTEGRADRASDVYSAAVILFEMLAGRVPFPYKSAGQVIRAQITEDAPDILTLRADVPEAVAAVVARGLSAQPDERQASAAEWRADLERVSPSDRPAAAGPEPGATLGPGDLAVLAAGEMAAAGVSAAAGASGSPHAAAPPAGPPHHPPGPPPAGGAAPAPNPPNKRRRRILAAAAAIVVLAGILTAISLASAGTAGAEVFRQPASVPGAHPFSPSVATPQLARNILSYLRPPTTAFSASTTAVVGSLPSFVGSTPGLYGGTRQLAVCDASTLVSFLEANPTKAAAWAGVEGIASGAIATYVGGLTDVILRADTRVTNHGFVDGAATTLPEILQAGTAVLVDHFGIPRARCYCGNPLTPPVAASSVHYTGPSWPGFSPTKVAVVEPAPALTTLVIVDVQTGIPFVRPTGTNGPSDTGAPINALAGSPFGGTASAGSPVAGAPSAPGAVAGTYTVNSETGTSGCTGIQYNSGGTFTADVKRNQVTLDFAGQTVQAPYDRSTATLQIVPTGSTSPGTSSLTGRFINGSDGSVHMALLLPVASNCTVTIAGTRTGPLNEVTPPPTTTTTPSTVPPTTTTTAAQPVDVTTQGTVSASSTYSSQYPASNAVDGNLTTSWFSAGSSDGPSSTFNWQGTTDRMITNITIIGNEGDADPTTRNGYGYAQTEIQVLNSAGTVVFDQTYPGPSDSNRDIHATPNVVGESVHLILKNRESPDCGGFSELTIEALPS